MSWCRIKGVLADSKSRTTPPPAPVIVPIKITTSGLHLAFSAIRAPDMANKDRPKASATSSAFMGTGNRRTHSRVSTVAPTMLNRGQGSSIQKMGCRFSSRSRIVPPPTAVTEASTRMPSRSSCAAIPASAPLMANTATPKRSNKRNSMTQWGLGYVRWSTSLAPACAARQTQNNCPGSARRRFPQST